MVGCQNSQSIRGFNLLDNVVEQSVPVMIKDICSGSPSRCSLRTKEQLTP